MRMRRAGRARAAAGSAVGPILHLEFHQSGVAHHLLPLHEKVRAEPQPVDDRFTRLARDLGCPGGLQQHHDPHRLHDPHQLRHRALGIVGRRNRRIADRHIEDARLMREVMQLGVLVMHPCRRARLPPPRLRRRDALPVRIDGGDRGARVLGEPLGRLPVTASGHDDLHLRRRLNERGHLPIEILDRRAPPVQHRALHKPQHRRYRRDPLRSHGWKLPCCARGYQVGRVTALTGLT